MRKILKVALFNEERAYTELDLPASPYTVLDALEKLRLDEGAPHHWGIADKLQIGRLAKYLDQDGSFFELNALCQQLAVLNEEELAVVEGLARMEHDGDAKPVPLPRLIDMAYSTDCCHLVEKVVNDHTLGRFCAAIGFVPEVGDLSDKAFELLDFAKIGQKFRQDEGGVFTSQGYVQKHDELRQVYGTLDLTPKRPDYAILVETSSGCQIKLPLPMGEAVADGPVQCVDCAAPSLIGLSGTIGTWDMLAHRLTYLTVDGELTKYKAVLNAVRCDELGRALTLADKLDELKTRTSRNSSASTIGKTPFSTATRPITRRSAMRWRSRRRITSGSMTRWPAARGWSWCPITTAHLSADCTRTFTFSIPNGPTVCPRPPEANTRRWS